MFKRSKQEERDEAKCELLAKVEGYKDIDTLIETKLTNAIIPGICMNPDCDYTCGVEPDSDTGWCDECNTNTVKSALRLKKLI